jgi:hypothetical protein
MPGISFMTAIMEITKNKLSDYLAQQKGRNTGLSH